MRLFFGESNYEKNRRSLQEAMDELLSHMKGHDWSFRREITDEKGDFSQEKLCALVDGMLSLWAEDKRDGRSKDVAEAYLEPRLKLYRLYLYLVMRCSLCQGAYSDAHNGVEMKERTDFAFLLEQAKRLCRDWCVIAESDGKRRNEPYCGFDEHFGFHLYHPFNEFASGHTGADWALSTYQTLARDQPDRFWTNEGNHRPIDIRWSGKIRAAEPQPEEPEEPEEQILPDEEPYDAGDDCEDYDDYEDYDPAEDDDFWTPEWDYEFRLAEMEQHSEQDTRRMALEALWMRFEYRQEYLSACEDFQKCFWQAAPYVLRDFYADLEEIADLYLLKREVPPLMDMDKALDVYSRVRDGALRQAKRYGRGIQWKDL